MKRQVALWILKANASSSAQVWRGLSRIWEFVSLDFRAENLYETFKVRAQIRVSNDPNVHFLSLQVELIGFDQQSGYFYFDHLNQNSFSVHGLDKGGSFPRSEPTYYGVVRCSLYVAVRQHVIA